MPWVLLCLGAAVLLVTVADTVATVIRADARAGPVTRAVTRSTWAVARRVPSRGRHRRPSPMTGVVVTIAVLLAWAALTLLGWSLVFASSEEAVLRADTGEPADGWSRVYFAGFAATTLGVGDVVPGGSVWEVLTVAAAASGLALATLVISYVTSVTAAVALERQLARAVTQLGRSPEEIVGRAWDGRSFGQVEASLHTITQQLNELAEEHLRFPVLFYFAATERGPAHWPAVAALDDALLVLDELVDPDVRPPTLVVEPPRQAIAGYLENLPVRVGERDEAPPRPTLARLSALGVPVRDRAEADRALERAAEHRRRVGAVLDRQGWPVDHAWAHDA